MSDTLTPSAGVLKSFSQTAQGQACRDPRNQVCAISDSKKTPESSDQGANLQDLVYSR